jgi:hypothetical protein
MHMEAARPSSAASSTASGVGCASHQVTDSPWTDKLCTAADEGNLEEVKRLIACDDIHSAHHRDINAFNSVRSIMVYASECRMPNDCSFVVSFADSSD